MTPPPISQLELPSAVGDGSLPWGTVWISADVTPRLFGCVRDHIDPAGAAIFGPDRMYAYLTPFAHPDAKAPPGASTPNVMTDAQLPLDRVFYD